MAPHCWPDHTGHAALLAHAAPIVAEPEPAAEPENLSSLRIPASLHFPRREAAEAENKGLPEGHEMKGSGTQSLGLWL